MKQRGLSKYLFRMHQVKLEQVQKLLVYKTQPKRLGLLQDQIIQPRNGITEPHLLPI